MLQKTTLFITLLSYAIIVSQPFMYILSLKNTQLALSGSSYTELRQLIDANMRGLFKFVIYAALLANLSLLLVQIKNPSGLLFLAAAFSFLMLLADIILTLKGNIPLNDIINSWSMKDFPSNWQEVRAKWFTIFTWRQIVTIAGFVALLGATVFGKK